MHPIIKELIESGISVRGEFDVETDKKYFIIDGFYKSGTVKLTESETGFILESRYNSTDDIKCVCDIVKWNYYWWKASKDRCESWKSPDAKWMPLLLKYGFIEEVVNVEYVGLK